MRRLMRDQRGQIIIFVALSLVFLVVVAGYFGSDVSRLVSDKGELQAALDAAALAGAGKLGFDATVFPTVRNFAIDMATKSTNRSGTVTLTRNDANDPNAFAAATPPYGDILLGIWDPSKPRGIGAGLRFEPSVDGTRVNAVACRYKRQVRASFLSLWGAVQTNVSTQAIATANPPKDPPSCPFPIGLSSCPFTQNAVFTSGGCGVTIKFIASTTQADQGNTAAWINMSATTTPGANDLTTAIDAAVAGDTSGTCAAGPGLGDSVGTNNGMITPAFNDMVGNLKSHFGPISAPITDKSGQVTYDGSGWEIAVPVIQTSCDPATGTTGPITGAHQIIGWTRMVMTQAWDPTGSNGPKIGQGCVVNNPSDTATWPYCTAAKKDLPASLTGGNSRSLWGYYACGISKSPPVINPVPISALATKLRLVQ